VAAVDLVPDYAQRVIASALLVGRCDPDVGGVARLSASPALAGVNVGCSTLVDTFDAGTQQLLLLAEVDHGAGDPSELAKPGR
jgi:hypothetical protein